MIKNERMGHAALQINPTDIKIIMKEYYESFDANYFVHVDERQISSKVNSTSIQSGRNRRL